jgi:hypothetical protein
MLCNICARGNRLGIHTSEVGAIAARGHLGRLSISATTAVLATLQEMFAE